MKDTLRITFGSRHEASAFVTGILYAANPKICVNNRGIPVSTSDGWEVVIEDDREDDELPTAPEIPSERG